MADDNTNTPNQQPAGDMNDTTPEVGNNTQQGSVAQPTEQQGVNSLGTTPSETPNPISTPDITPEPVAQEPVTSSLGNNNETGTPSNTDASNTVYANNMSQMQDEMQQDTQPFVDTSIMSEPEHKKSKFSTVIIAGIVIGFFLVLIGGAAFYMFVYSPSKSKQEPIKQEQPQQQVDQNTESMKNEDTMQKGQQNTNTDVPENLEDDPVIKALDKPTSGGNESLDDIKKSLESIDFDGIDSELQQENFE